MWDTATIRAVPPGSRGGHLSRVQPWAGHLVAWRPRPSDTLISAFPPVKGAWNGSAASPGGAGDKTGRRAALSVGPLRPLSSPWTRPPSVRVGSGRVLHAATGAAEPPLSGKGVFAGAVKAPRPAEAGGGRKGLALGRGRDRGSAHTWTWDFGLQDPEGIHCCCFKPHGL